jgi:hypothetical protein
MAKKIGLALAIVVAAVAIFLFVSRKAGNGIPKEFLGIPGFQSSRLVSGDRFNRIYEVSIDDNGKTITCILTLRMDADSNPVMPGQDEVFTVVASDQTGFWLYDDSGKLGQIPGVFITKVDSKQNFHIQKPGEEPFPVSVVSGQINQVSTEFDTFVKGPEGLAVRIVSNGKEIAGGRLPLNLKLGEKKSEAIIDGIFVSRKLSSGLIHIYSGRQPISKGSNTVSVSAQAVGSKVWFHEGEFVGFNDGICMATKDGKTFYGNDKKEIVAQTLDINPKMGAIHHDGGIFWIDNTGLLRYWHPEKKVKMPSIYFDKPIAKSGNYIITGNRVYTTGLEPANPLPGWQWCVDGCFMKLENGILTGFKDKRWQIKADIKSTDICQTFSDGRAYFTDGKGITGLFDTATGETDTDDGLMMQDVGDIGFPDGVTIKNGIQTDSAGKNVWSRKSWTLEKFGQSGIYCFNPKTGEHELINHDTGLKAVFWNTANLKLIHFDSSWLVFSVDGHVLSVQRLIAVH